MQFQNTFPSKYPDWVAEKNPLPQGKYKPKIFHVLITYDFLNIIYIYIYKNVYVLI